MTLEQAHELQRKELNLTIERYKYWLSIEKNNNKYLSDIVYGDFEVLKNNYTFLQQEFDKLSAEFKAVSESNLKFSERSLRKFKRNQLQAVTFRSNKSVEHLCNCMSIIESNRLYDANIYKIACDAFS